MRVTVIGGGNVGGAIAFALLYSDDVEEIVIQDKDKTKERALALDLEDVAWLTGKRVSQSEPYTSDIVVIAAGKNQRAGQNRKELYDANLAVVDSIVSKMKQYTGKVIIVTNPVFAITEEISKRYNLDYIKLNTQIDTVRLHALTDGIGTVCGTHDDEQIVVVNGEKNEYLSAAIQNKAGIIIDGRGYTCYGIASVVRRLIEDEARKQTEH